MADLTATIVLPPVPRSVPAARRLLGELLAAWAAEAYHRDAALLLSELVTNVIRHVEGPANLTLRVDLSGPGLRVCVVDSSHGVAAPRTPAGGAGGYGLSLVAVLARRWGSEEQPDGKQVWFELDAAAS